MSQQVRIWGKKLSFQENSQKSAQKLRPGGWIITESPEGNRQRFMYHEGNRNLWSASLNGKLWVGEWLNRDSTQEGQASTGTTIGAADTDLTAQFPGKVRKLLIQQDTQVQEGDSLLLIEAMKMEFTIKAPFTGKVKKILISEGQQLQPGDRLIEIVTNRVEE